MKLFLDVDCGKYFCNMGVLLFMLVLLKWVVLDFGCGIGWMLLFFVKVGYEVMGVDILEDVVWIVWELVMEDGVGGVEFFVVDYEGFVLLWEFDYVFFYDVLYYVEDE